jgi:hypothetical protein
MMIRWASITLGRSGAVRAKRERPVRASRSLRETKIGDRRFPECLVLGKRSTTSLFEGLSEAFPPRLPRFHPGYACGMQNPFRKSARRVDYKRSAWLGILGAAGLGGIDRFLGFVPTVILGSIGIMLGLALRYRRFGSIR